MKVYLYNPVSESQPPDQWADYLQSYNTWSNLPDAGFKEIYVSGMYYSEEEIQKLTKKLRKNGVLILTGPDILEIGRSINTGYLTTAKCRELVGHNKLYTCLEIAELLEKAGLKVTLKRINNFRFTVQGQRI